MYAGQPLRLTDLLPHGMRMDDVYSMLAVAVTVGCIVAINSGFGQRRVIASRIRNIQERRKELRGEFSGPKKRRSPESSVNFMRAVAMRLQLTKSNQLGKTQAELIDAGFRSKDAIYVMAFFNLVLPIVLAIVGLVIMNLNDVSQSKWATMNYAWPIFGAYIGLKLPWLYLRRKRKHRHIMIQRALPDMLDLMTICAEAGLSLSMMLDRVSRELQITYPEMAEELGLTSVEMGFLPDRNKALSNLAERCSLSEVRGICSVLIQTEKYGTPIAQALRVLSSEFRQARMLRAEQKAAKLPALMTVPMIVFILPTLFIVIISPAIVRLIDTLGK